jgi:hypothetical protein
MVYPAYGVVLPKVLMDSPILILIRVVTMVIARPFGYSSSPSYLHVPLAFKTTCLPIRSRNIDSQDTISQLQGHFQAGQ